MSPELLYHINSIEFEDLHFIEADLCFYEKVSLGFLLYGDSNPHYILQKLVVLSETPRANSDILECYATSNANSNWRVFMVEALAVIKANKVLRKLGLVLQQVYTYFLPHIAETRLHINPVLKALYFMCETLTALDCRNIVLEIRDATNTEVFLDDLPFHNFDNLEVFLLQYITKNIINVSGTDATDLSILIDYLKLNDMKNISEVLIYTLQDNNINAKEDGNMPDNCGKNNQQVQNIKPLQDPSVRHVPPTDLSDCYKIKRKTAGYVLIINQKTFHRSKDFSLHRVQPRRHLKERQGTDHDKRNLEKTFASFGYKPIVRDDLEYLDMLDLIRDVVKRSSICDSIVVCILSHGIEGAVYGSDSIPVKIEEIEKLLMSGTLAGKPKMLIIQACQGQTLQKAKIPQGGLERDSGDDECLNYRDMVKAMSTVPGFASLRHTRYGSWFIQTLCAKITELGDSQHMLEILTAVNDVIGDKRGSNNECMTPISSQTLRKKFRLPNRIA